MCLVIRYCPPLALDRKLDGRVNTLATYQASPRKWEPELVGCEGRGEKNSRTLDKLGWNSALQENSWESSLYKTPSKRPFNSEFHNKILLHTSKP